MPPEKGASSEVPHLMDLKRPLSDSKGLSVRAVTPSYSTMSPLERNTHIGSTPMKEYRAVFSVPSTDSSRKLSPSNCSLRDA
jgi:hypothetical protein